MPSKHGKCSGRGSAEDARGSGFRRWSIKTDTLAHAAICGRYVGATDDQETRVSWPARRVKTVAAAVLLATVLLILAVIFGNLRASAPSVAAHPNAEGETPQSILPFTSAQSRRVFILGDSLCVLSTFQSQWTAELRAHHWLDAGGVCWGGVSTSTGPALIHNAPSDATIVISLGTNDLYPWQINHFRSYVEATLDAAPGHNVLWIMPGINHRSPLYRFEGTEIAVLRGERSRYPSLRLLQWDHEYNRYPHEQTRDGVHSTTRGFGIRAAYIIEALDRILPRRMH
jgi:hypothetical protein